MQLEYDEEGRLIKKQNPEGDCVEWVYNENNTLQKTISEDGSETVFEYNSDNFVEKVCNSKGEAIVLTYDKYKNINQVMLPNGGISEWKFDCKGNCLNYKNSLGTEEEYIMINLIDLSMQN